MAAPWEKYTAQETAGPWSKYANPASYDPWMEAGAPFQGFNEGVDALINTPGSLLNLGAQAINYGANQLGYQEPLPEQPFKPVSVATQFNADYEPQTAIGQYGRSIGQVAGASILPEAGMIAKAGSMTPQAVRTAAPIIEKLATTNPATTLKGSLPSIAGAGIGTELARQNDLGPAGELIGGLAGGFAGPAAWAPAARTGGGIRNAVRFANNQIKAAQNPDQAAVDTLAKALVNAKTLPEEIRGQVLQGPQGKPLLSKDLQGRGITEEHLANMISRKFGGEDSAAIAKSYGISPKTLDRYIRLYEENNPTPQTIPDIVTELRGVGGAMPVLRRGRSAFGVAGDQGADAAQALYNRQMDQSGRVANIIQQSSIGGKTAGEKLQELATAGRAEESAAYNLARKNAQPVNIRSIIRAARAKFPQEGGKISEQMNKAIDLFFKGGLVQGQGNKLRYSRAMEIVNDVPTYLRRRHELDQMIASSYENNKATPLTRSLTQFRQKLNDAARRNNDALAQADARFSGNRSMENLIKQGEDLGKRLTPKSRQALRNFSKLTATQQEIFRTSFEEKMASLALERQKGVAAANQFSTPAFAKIVEQLYPKSAGREIYERGQRMLRNLNREAISTATTNFQTGRGNSPTAPWSADIESRMEMARAGADLATGRWTKVLGNFSDWLARQIGQRAAEAELKILAETDPAKLLTYANRLDKSVKNEAAKQQILQELRQARRPQLVRPSTSIGVAVTSQDQQR